MCILTSTHTNALPNRSSDFVNNVTLCQMENIGVLKMDLVYIFIEHRG